MKHHAIAIALMLGVAYLAPAPAHADMETERLVTWYRLAPGKQVAFMEWLARKEQAEREAGISNTQIFVHIDGPSWDFLMVDSGEEATPEQLETYYAAMARLGIPRGTDAWVELREFIAEHEDMLVAGPTTATEWLKTRKVKK